MYKINKVKNYKQFAKLLEEKTGCSVSIEIIDKDHIHYQINDEYKTSLGILCIDHGDVAFAPFATHDDNENEQFISVIHFVQVDGFNKLMNAFKEMFVVDESEI